jgi:hypothetical protein
MSYPSCKAGQMQSHEIVESVDRNLEESKSTLDEWRNIALELIEMLRQEVNSEESANRRPQAPE